ncbi:response regulator transcription factor [Poseidonocella sedimentorum]|uniref:DNA-binding response regulator, NarL/FixJ family, contains REC and HTH domains n=1 Tax=Poseidonocella sedimentorum TaxID=871652 RepID=A0A1I6D9V2_9RHOB|nr:response regulator transcription factor [Poseidonocella sedimentorum]SFR02137.1 DNA-binding response regulator, NarL/FixJ family, contains REC and HTH domains [Poseidonocella sedimentorum]
MRLLIADDHNLVRDAIAALLLAEGAKEVFAAKNLEEAMHLVRTDGPFDLVLLDYNMPGMSGLAGLRQMIDHNEGQPVALISGTAAPAVAKDAVEAGAAGFVPKTLPSKSIYGAAQIMIGGDVFVPFEFMNREEEAHTVNLSKREHEVLRGICAGQSNKEIARELLIQEVTVKLHVRTLSRKLAARNRTHAAAIARSLNLA